jgi:hypothetical protein
MHACVHILLLKQLCRIADAILSSSASVPYVLIKMVLRWFEVLTVSVFMSQQDPSAITAAASGTANGCSAAVTTPTPLKHTFSCSLGLACRCGLLLLLLLLLFWSAVIVATPAVVVAAAVALLSAAIPASLLVYVSEVVPLVVLLGAVAMSTMLLLTEGIASLL